MNSVISTKEQAISVVEGFVEIEPVLEPIHVNPTFIAKLKSRGYEVEVTDCYIAAEKNNHVFQASSAAGLLAILR